ncbi:MAG TPA: hypothetical protein VF258_08060, partial [Luteolibacter sp.]
MEVLLINHSLYTGGVETLMLRVANWLVCHGHGCSILLRDGFEGDLRPMLDSRVEVRCVGNGWDWLAAPGLRHLAWNALNLPQPELVYTMEQNWAVIALLVRDLFPDHPPAVATGAYHLNQFCYEPTTAQPGRLALFQREIY